VSFYPMVRKSHRVLFVIPELICGGAERTFVNILNHLDRSRFKPILALYSKRGPLLELLQRDVEVHELGCTRARFAVPGLMRLIWRLDPDAIVSTLPYPNLVTVLCSSLSGRKKPVLVRESNHRTAAGIETSSWKERMVGWSYRRATRVITLSNGVRADVISRYGIAGDRVVTLYNPIDIAGIEDLAREPISDSVLNTNGRRKFSPFKIVAVGVLKYQKGYDLLIEALAKLKSLPLRLWIIGEGKERHSLVSLADRLGVGDRVSFVGFQRNPYAWMARTDLFVLPSRWEGFGHVIAEAMVCGVPVLATRCPSGPEEIITDGVDGQLCQPHKVESLAQHIEALSKDLEGRRSLAKAAKMSVRRFDVKQIVRGYENLLSEVIN